MNSLHKSIVGLLIGESVMEDNPVVKKLNAVSGKKLHGETPAFIHIPRGPAADDDHKPKHRSAVKDQYVHEHENQAYNVYLYHHKDNTASVKVVHHKQPGSNKTWSGQHDSDVHVHEKHLKDLPSAIEHVKALHSQK
jgi:hypothetical protein